MEDVGVWDFIMVLLLIFALCVVIAGGFTAYFGAGKSRKIGIGLILIGLIIGFIFTMPFIRDITGIPPDDIGVLNIVINAAIILFAAILGAVIALVLFLVAIMKS